MHWVSIVRKTSTEFKRKQEKKFMLTAKEVMETLGYESMLVREEEK